MPPSMAPAQEFFDGGATESRARYRLPSSDEAPSICVHLSGGSAAGGYGGGRRNPTRGLVGHRMPYLHGPLRVFLPDKLPSLPHAPFSTRNARELHRAIKEGS